MADAGTVGRYFRTKFQQWALADGSVLHHIDRVGRDGLASEFRSDPGFGQVRPFLSGARRRPLAPETVRSAEEYLSALFGFPLAPAIEIELAAVADACGCTSEADRSATAAATAIVLTAAAVAFGGFLPAVPRAS